VLARGLKEGRLPNLARLLGGPGLERGQLFPLLAPAPSITFASQASLFTGAHPSRHGIPGNQFFDRFGQHSDGQPRLYAFDAGDTLEVNDAVQVFTEGLASNCLLAPTLYEQLAGRPPAGEAVSSIVIGHMYARGASDWRPPSIVDIARFTKGGGLFGLPSEDFDRQAVERALDALAKDGLPAVFTMYFMGVDHESHAHGPQAQLDYLSRAVDGYVGELWQAVLQSLPAKAAAPFCAVISDHGQVGVPPDDRHSLRLAFPFERELGHLFDALGLDVHDYPGEDPDCDAVVASNGGLAHVYLQNRKGRWADAPDFQRDVLPVAKAFWEAHGSGKYAGELEGTLSAVLVRNVEAQGWEAMYRALTPSGEIVALTDWFGGQAAGLFVDPVHRLDNLAGPRTGDLLLASNGAQGFYFAPPLHGVHGGLGQEESWATLAFGWPDASEGEWAKANTAFVHAIEQRCQAEGGRLPSTADLLTGLLAVIG
jgi:hypothetical protein